MVFISPLFLRLQVSAGLVQPAVRAPSVQNVVTLRFRLAVPRPEALALWLQSPT